MMRLQRTDAFSSRMAEGLGQLYQDKHFTDFNIRVGEHTIPCHRAVLAVHSPVLKAMLLTDMQESTKREICLDSVPHHIVQHLIQYMYTGEVDIGHQQLMDTIQACDFLALLELKQITIDQVLDILNATNVIGFYQAAEQLKVTEITTRCRKMMCADFVKVSKCKQFQELLLSEVCDYITEASSEGVAEDHLLEAVLIWVQHDAEDRAKALTYLIKLISVEHCSLHCLIICIDTYATLLSTHPHALKCLTNCLVHVHVPSSQKERARTLVVVGGQTALNDVKPCWLLTEDRKLEQFAEISPDAIAQWQSLCLIPGGFVLTGGRNKAVCLMYSASALRPWKNLPDMITNRYGHGSTFHNGNIYVIGGMEINERTASVDFFPLSTCKWQHGPALPSPAVDTKVATLTNNICAFDEHSNNLYQLRKETESWKTMSKMPGNVCDGVSMVTVNDRLFVAGGEQKCCNWYIPLTDTWSSCQHPRLVHGYGALAFHQNRVFFLGGNYFEKDMVGVEEYDIEKDEWSVSDITLPLPVLYHQAFVLEKSA